MSGPTRTGTVNAPTDVLLRDLVVEVMTDGRRVQVVVDGGRPPELEGLAADARPRLHDQAAHCRRAGVVQVSDHQTTAEASPVRPSWRSARSGCAAEERGAGHPIQLRRVHRIDHLGTFRFVPRPEALVSCRAGSPVQPELQSPKEAATYAVVRNYEDEASDIVEQLRRRDLSLTEVMSAIDGFVAYYLLDTGTAG